MVGYKNSVDEAGYTAWSLFKESGLSVPMIWEGKKGEPSKPVMPLDLNVRPILDGNYIIPKTVEYIKRNAAAKLSLPSDETPAKVTARRPFMAR